MPRDIAQPTVNKYGAEEHPAFGMVNVVRPSQTPGAVLFDSDVKHQHTIRLTVSRADRKRDLTHDWIHGGQTLVEIEMSEAQWASLVSSIGGTGVPVTIRATPDDYMVPGLPYDPRLAHSMNEVKGGADRTFGPIKAAMEAYDALPKDAKAKERREALDRIRGAVRHAEANLTFAASSLNKHAENVVQKAKADVEAMVTAKAAQLGLTGEQARFLELPLGDVEVYDEAADEQDRPELHGSPPVTEWQRDNG